MAEAGGTGNAKTSGVRPAMMQGFAHPQQTPLVGAGTWVQLDESNDSTHGSE
jgi:hypothetical protein